jgi:hypothetical protein
LAASSEPWFGALSPRSTGGEDQTYRVKYASTAELAVKLAIIFVACAAAHFYREFRPMNLR